MKKRFLSKYDGKKYTWFNQVREIIIMIIFAFLFLQFILGVSMVRGDSMYPTLENGDFVLFLRIAPKYDYGDIVYIKMPSGDKFVKRVVALAGDTVDIHDGKLYVNGVEETSGYAYGETEAKSKIEYPYQVEEGRVFVLGDNREISNDSRTLGSLSERQIKGKLILY